MLDIISDTNPNEKSTSTTLLVPESESSHVDKPFEQHIFATTTSQMESSYYVPARESIVEAPLRIVVKGDIEEEHETHVFKTDGTSMRFITEGYGIGTSFKEISSFLDFLEIPYTLDSVIPLEDN